MVLLDTHIWLWWLLGDGSLSNKERAALDELAFSKQLAISRVSVWETEMLERKGRIQLLPNFIEWTKKATHSDIIQVLALDSEVIYAQRTLPEDFHSDPADRLITATAFLADIPLYTKDRKIIESKACQIWKL